MSTTTKPIWEDPVARAMVCVGATVLSVMLLVQYITIPYVLMPAAELWMSYVLPPFETYIASPEVLIETIGAGAATAGLFSFFTALAAVSLLSFVPLTIAVGVPLVVSYAFWMRLVYKRIE